MFNFKQVKKTIISITTLCILPITSYAATTGKYPWDKTFSDFSSDLTSSTVMTIGIIAIAFCGLFIAFGDLQGGAKKGLYVALGISIALAAPSILAHIGGNAAGAIIF